KTRPSASVTAEESERGAARRPVRDQSPDRGSHSSLVSTVLGGSDDIRSMNVPPATRTRPSSRTAAAVKVRAVFRRPDRDHRRFAGSKMYVLEYADQPIDSPAAPPVISARPSTRATTGGASRRLGRLVAVFQAPVTGLPISTESLPS